MWLPPFKILKGLFAALGQFSLASGEDYEGPYFETATGDFFTGTGPSPEQQKLIPSLEVQSELDKFMNSHGDLKQASTVIVYPKPKDYKTGYFIRYFIKDTRNNKIVEVDLESYKKYKQEVYIKSIPIKWILDKPVKDIFNTGYLFKGAATRNREATVTASRVLVGLDKYITNYGQFADIESDVEGYQFIELPEKEQLRLIKDTAPIIQEAPIRPVKSRFKKLFKKPQKIKNNLYTSGGRYKVQGTNSEYKGFYHIHPVKGAMVGAYHTSTPHKKLIPLNTNITYIDTSGPTVQTTIATPGSNMNTTNNTGYTPSSSGGGGGGSSSGGGGYSGGSSSGGGY